MSQEDTLLSRGEVCQKLSISEPTLNKLMRQEGFPRPAYRLGQRSCRWSWNEVVAWLATRHLGAGG